MAVLAIGAVGAIVGGSAWGIGIGLTAAMGWNIGLTVGGLLFAPKGQNINQQGPRLGDLKVQSSTYGNPIPIVYGSMRIAGNMIWSTDRIPTAHTTTQSGGGKGGGGGSVTQTSYTYSQSFAIALCEGEIAGVRKIWANGKLIYNLSDTADIATIVASNKSATGIRIYTGSETTTADSLIQAHVGAADTPAYRGIAYVVFENLQLENYNNNTPNLEFEVVEGSEVGFVGQLAGNPSTASYSFIYESINRVLTSVTYLNSARAGIVAVQPASVSGSLVGISGGVASFAVNSSPYGGSITLFDEVTGLFSAPIFDIATLGTWYGTVHVRPSTPTQPRGAGQPIYFTHYLSGEAGSDKVIKLDIVLDTWTVTASAAMPANSRPKFIASKLSGIDVTLYTCFSNGSGGIYAFDGNSLAVKWVSSTVPTPPTMLHYYALTDYVIAFSQQKAYIFDGTTGSAVGSAITGSIYMAYDETRNRLWSTNGSSALYYVDVASPGSPVLDTNFVPPSGFALTDMRCVDGIVWFRNGITADYYYDPDLRVLSSIPPLASSIVSDICARVGLTAGQIDVTALTDEVSGYVVQRGTARSQLEQLMQAFYFDAVESDGKIKFVKRGGSSAVSIPEDDLAAHEYGSAPPDTLITTRKQEMELPVECNVQYMDTGAAYQIGTQRTQRLTTESENKISVNLAIAMTATKAKQITDVLMYDAWTGRTTFAQSHGWKYSYLEPTDIITVTKDGRSYVMRIVDEDASGGIYARQAVLEDISVYSQTGVAAELPAAVETVAAVPLTNLLLLDIPILRDQDDGVGFYAAACGYGDGWYGAQSFKSNDGGATWGSFGNGLLNDAAIGTASTALGDFTQNIFDESNSVTVVMINGELASDTELNVLNGANVALLGNEVIQFRDATLVSAGTYTLTGLLRGRQGTEWARSTHATGDRFVLLSSSTTYLFSGAVAEYDLERKYRGVSFGGFLDDATTINFTNTAVAQIPYAPVHLGGGRNAAGDLTLSWIRRTRMSGGWNNYSDVPLGEAAEAYVVEIYDDSDYTAVVRTISGLTSATTSYTAAQQTTDFGAPQAAVYWKVYQVSATVGNGYEARGIT